MLSPFLLAQLDLSFFVYQSPQSLVTGQRPKSSVQSELRDESSAQWGEALGVAHCQPQGTMGFPNATYMYLRWRATKFGGCRFVDPVSLKKLETFVGGDRSILGKKRKTPYNP